MRGASREWCALAIINQTIDIMKKEHFEALKERYNLICDQDEFERIMCIYERKLEKFATDECSNPNYDREGQERCERATLSQLKDFCGTVEGRRLMDKELYLNRDPRGHAIKLDIPSNEVDHRMHRDWGGYVIVCPED